MTLAQLAQLRESEDKVEFKRGRNNFSYDGSGNGNQSERRKCIQGYIVAFANEGGGRLIFGMEDEHPHAIVGTSFAEGSTGALEDRIYSDLEIRIHIEEIHEDNKRVLVFHIPGRPVGKLLKFEGVALMRIGESLRNMNDDEMYKVLSEQEPDFSARICEGLQLSDLDLMAISIMKRSYARKQNNSQFALLPDQQILSDLQLLTDEKLNYAALILLGKKDVIDRFLPQAKTIWEFRYTDSQIPYDFREVVDDPLFIGIDRLWKLVNDKNGSVAVRNKAYIFKTNSFHEEIIREAILNAVAHRDYRITSEIVIKQFPKKIVISNPGGFPKGVTLQNILTVNSTPRSRRMAEVLEKTGLVERSGQGVDKIFAITLSEGKPAPSYEDSDDFQVTLRILADIEDGAFHMFLESFKDPERDDTPPFNVPEIVALYKIKNGQFADTGNYEILNGLEKRGVIVRSSGHTRRYSLAEAYHKLATGAERIGSRYVVAEVSAMMLALQSGKVSIGKLEDALQSSLNRNQIKYLLGKLIEDKTVISGGVGRGTWYTLADPFNKLTGDTLVFEVVNSLRNTYDDTRS